MLTRLCKIHLDGSCFPCSHSLGRSDCGSARVLLLFGIRLVHTFSDVSRSDKQDPPERRPLCGWTMLEGHRMELSGGRVLGPQPASRKSWTAVHCRCKWPLRVQCDGQFRAAAHTGSLCWGSWDFLAHTMSHTLTYTHFWWHKCLFFLSPSYIIVADQASTVALILSSQAPHNSCVLLSLCF